MTDRLWVLLLNVMTIVNTTILRASVYWRNISLLTQILNKSLDFRQQTFVYLLLRKMAACFGLRDHHQTVIRPSSDHHQTVIRPSSDHHQIIRPSSDRHQTIIRSSADHHQTVIRPSSDHHQIVLRPSSDHHQTNIT